MDKLNALHQRRDFAGLSLAGAAMVRPILARMVRRGSIPGIDDDLVGVGNLAVCEAVRTWEPARGAFSTHIGNKVKGAVLDYQNKELNKGIGGKSRKDRTPIAFVYLDHLGTDEEGDDE